MESSRVGETTIVAGVSAEAGAGGLWQTPFCVPRTMLGDVLYRDRPATLLAGLIVLSRG